MDIQYKPTKPKKEKSVKTPKTPKAEKAIKFNSTVQSVKTSKPAKEHKTAKTPKAEKAVSFGKASKVKTEKPLNVEHAGKKLGFLSKVDPKWILGGAVVLIAAIAVVVLTVVLPAIEENGQQIKSIMISSTPDKTIYLVGEEANYDGLRVFVTRNNGETFTVRAVKCQISGFDSAKAGSQAITVSYEGFTASFFIKVEEPPKVVPVLTGIRLETLPKTQYKLGEWLDTNGGVIVREYADGSTANITLVNSYVSGFADIKTPGTFELTVKYKENVIVCKTTYTITVTE